MGDIKDVVSGAGNLVQGAISQTVSGLISNAFAKRAEKRQMNRTKELMALEDQYQRNLAEDQMSIRKLALQKAGYSTADPEGAGTTVPTSNASGSSVPSIAPDYSALGSNISSMAQARFTASQTKLNEIEAQYRGQLLQKEIDKYNIDIKTAQETLEPRIQEINTHIDQMEADKKLKIDQAKQVRQTIDNLKATLDGIQLDNKFKTDINPKLVKKAQVELDNLVLDGRYKDAVARLADYGIIVGADWFTNIASIVRSGHSVDLLNEVVNCYNEVINKVPGATKSVLQSTLGSAVKGVVDTMPDSQRASFWAILIASPIGSLLGLRPDLYGKPKK